jgi:hypothetical protein
MFWARLVDVHDQDAQGVHLASPLYRDFPISESVQTDAFRYQLSTNPITQRTRLVIRKTHGARDDGTGTFDQLLVEAQRDLAPVTPKNDDGSASGPFSLVARNAALVLRFDDLLQDDLDDLIALPEDVRLLVGYPPVTPFEARVFFDPNHGGVAGGAFHSTRVIVDCSVSETEAAAFPIPLQLNSDGLPGEPLDAAAAAQRLDPHPDARRAGQRAVHAAAQPLGRGPCRRARTVRTTCPRTRSCARCARATPATPTTASCSTSTRPRSWAASGWWSRTPWPTRTACPASTAREHAVHDAVQERARGRRHLRRERQLPGGAGPVGAARLRQRACTTCACASCRTRRSRTRASCSATASS